jgi:hypothetical protein
LAQVPIGKYGFLGQLGTKHGYLKQMGPSFPRKLRLSKGKWAQVLSRKHGFSMFFKGLSAYLEVISQGKHGVLIPCAFPMRTCLNPFFFLS